jgi:hypothetical protein
LQSCLSSSKQLQISQQSSSNEIIVVSLSTEGKGDHKISNINLFSSYQNGIIFGYCQQRHYSCHLLNHTLPALEGSLDDFRWHKIKILENTLTSATPDTKAFVWIGKLTFIFLKAYFYLISFYLSLFFHRF